MVYALQNPLKDGCNSNDVIYYDIIIILSLTIWHISQERMVSMMNILSSVSSFITIEIFINTIMNHILLLEMEQNPK